MGGACRRATSSSCSTTSRPTGSTTRSTPTAPDNGVGVELRARQHRAGRDRAGSTSAGCSPRPRRPARSRRARTASQGACSRRPWSARRSTPASARAASSTGSRRARRCIELKDGKQLPVGAIFDTTKGRVNLTVADGKGGTSLAWFYDGIFKVAQSRGPSCTNLTMVEPKLSCPRASAGLRPRRPRRRSRASCGARARASSARPGSSARRRSAARSGW